MNNYDYLILDGHNLYHKAYHVNAEMTHLIEGSRMRTGGIYGFLRSLNKLKRERLKPGGKVVVLFDNQVSKVETRKGIDQSYKSQREALPRSFFRGVEILQLILLRYDNDLSIVYRHKYEADDLTETILSTVPQGSQALLVSDDFDWARSIKDNVDWLARNGAVFTKENFKESFGFVPTINSVTMFKTLKGDPSDNIPNALPHFPKEKVYEVVARYRDVYTFLSAVEEGDAEISATWKKRVQEARDRLVKNYELISFQGVTTDDISENIYQCKYQPESLRMLYETVGINPDKFDPRFKNAKAYDEFADGFSWGAPKRV